MKTIFIATILLTVLPASAQETADTAVVSKGMSAKFAALPDVPDCATVAALKGDPGKGPSVIEMKFTPGCIVPWHWHTPSEQLMMVSGRAKAEMKDSGPVILRAGDYLNLTSRHVHQFTCLASCVLFDVTGAAPFDVHYVDAIGNEIPAEQALKAAPKPATKMAKPQKQE